jgi:hypothetical protein
VKWMIKGIPLSPGVSFERVLALDWDGLYVIQNHGSEMESMVVPEASTTLVPGNNARMGRGGVGGGGFRGEGAEM